MIEKIANRVGGLLPAVSLSEHAEPRLSNSNTLEHNSKAWARYDYHEYTQNNYGTVHEEDAQLIASMAAFYSRGQRYQNALELGVGTNLYPLIGLSPYVEHLTVIDIAPASVRYITRNIQQSDPNWQQFVDKFRSVNKIYGKTPLQELQNKILIRVGDATKLTGTFDLISTHCCIAEVATDAEDFIRLGRDIVSCLEMGKDFVATFAAESDRLVTYDNEMFYVVSVTESLLRETFNPILDNLIIRRFTSSTDKFRPGYKGLFFVTGTARFA